MAGKKKSKGNHTKANKTKKSEKTINGKTKDEIKKKEDEIYGSRTVASENTEIPVLSNIKIGSDSFRFPNGDSYCGKFEATIDRTIYRQGYGYYITKNNDYYRGEWHNDVLSDEEAKINYADGSSYNGNVQEFIYSGNGVYMFPDLTEMRCEFVANAPVNDVLMRDPTGHIWFGKVEKSEVRMKPVNHFLLNLKERMSANEQDKNKLRSRQSSTEIKGSVNEVDVEDATVQENLQQNMSTLYKANLHAKDEGEVVWKHSSESLEKKSEVEVHHMLPNHPIKERARKQKSDKKK